MSCKNTPVINSIGEVWKTVEWCPSVAVSNKGRVKSLNYRKSGTESILKCSLDGRGYSRISLPKDGKLKCVRVHQLVAEAFVEKVPGKCQVNHIDGDKTNNSSENLEWVTNQENQAHAWRIGMREKTREMFKVVGSTVGKENLQKANLRKMTPVYAVNKTDGAVLEFPSQMEASRALGIQQSNIQSCLCGKRNSAGGFVFFERR